MIREAGKEDLQACAEILADCLMWEKYERTLVDAAKFMEGEFYSGHHIWVYIESDTVIGFIGAIEQGMMSEFTYIRMLAVEKHHRGMGIGSQLLNYSEERMFSLSPLIFMMVPDFNVDAQRLYYRLGYKKVGEIPDYKKQGINEYLLLKRKALEL